MHPDAAGLDIGTERMWACVPTDRDPNPVQSFGTFTPDLNALVDWLVACKITTVAMESTGVYWIPIYDLLESRGLEAVLVNAHHLKMVPGRKSDVQDCQWIQRLHTYGLLQGSFRPTAAITTLRAYTRQRANLVEQRAMHIHLMQKALHQMNLQLTQVVSDITGLTGMQIMRAIVAGERDPVVLAQFRHPRCQSTQETIAKALTGQYHPEHVFALRQALTLYDCYTTEIAACDAQIAQHYATMQPMPPPDDPPSGPPPDPKPNTHSKNTPGFDVRGELYRVLGIDLTAVDGIHANTAQIILSEIGTDMGKWPSAKQFSSWLGLAPHNDITGGRVIRRRTVRPPNRAGHALRMAAQSLSRSQTSLGTFYRHIRAHAGPKCAVTATAHKLARIIYHMLKYHQPYTPVSSETYEAQQRDRAVRQLERRAAHLGFTLAPQAGAAVVS
ncbi:MAG: IS110 family transposase [Oscillochloridaceae bacterium umkhey_bin13]